MKIRVIDIETTGETPADSSIVEIGWCDVYVVRSDADSDPLWHVEAPRSVLVSSERPIPPETSAIHHIVDADLAGAPGWPLVHPMVLGPTGPLPGSDPIVAFAAHQAKFERSFIGDDITGGLPWICTYRCALRLWPEAPSHSNQALRYFRNPEGLDREAARVAHRAGPDAYVTAFHLRDMLAMAPLADLLRWSSRPVLQVNCRIGKFRGKPWSEVDSGFLEWLLDKDFDEDVKFTARHWLEKREYDQRTQFSEAADAA